MIVNVVLVIVAAVQVKSQELCPSVCECQGEQAICTNLFSDVTDNLHGRFGSALEVLRVTGRTNLELEEDRFQRWNITSLIYLDLSQNSITNIWQRAFYSLADLQQLYLYGNSITTLHPHTFYYNTHLTVLSLAKNCIIDIHQSTFQNNIWLRHLNISENEIILINPGTFNHNKELEWLDLERNNITDIHPTTFKHLSKLIVLNVSKNKIDSLKRDTFISNTELERIYLAGNSISDIHPLTFRNNSRLAVLDISRNKIHFIIPETFIHNGVLEKIYLSGNSIYDILPLTFRSNRRLTYLDVSGNKIASIHLDTFNNIYAQSSSMSDIHQSSFRNNNRLRHLDTSRNNISHGTQTGILPAMNLIQFNRIRDHDRSTIRNQTPLETLSLSGNMLERLGPELFSDCTKLRKLFLSANSISAISTSAFHGLEQLELLDLSNNSIVQLHPLVFMNTFTTKHRQNHQVSNLKYLNLDQNKIRSFNFELYFPMSSNSVTSTPTFELQYLNISSNNLHSLDVTSVKWLNLTTARIDLERNPWKCDCSGLGVAWRELRYKLTVRCASPEQMKGKSWGATEELCGHTNTSAEVPDMDNQKITTLTVIHSSTTESGAAKDSHEEKQKTVSVATHSLTTDGDVSTRSRSKNPSTMSNILIVVFVLSVCTLIAGAIILVVLFKKLRESSKTPQHSDVYAQGATCQPLINTSFIDSNSTNDCTTEHIYETIM